MNGRDHRVNLTNRSGQRKRRIDRMGRTDRPCFRSNGPVCANWPGPRISKKILGLLTAIPDEVSDFSVGYHLAGKLRCGRADVIETDHVDAAARSSAATIRGFRQKWSPSGFSQKRLAERERRLGNRAMGVLRTGDDDCLYCRVVDEHLPVGGRRCKAVGGPSVSAVSADLQTISSPGRSGVEHCADRGHGDRMGFAHVPPPTMPMPIVPTKFPSAARRSSGCQVHKPYLGWRVNTGAKGCGGWRCRALQGTSFWLSGRAGMDLYADPPGTRVEEAARFTSALGGSAANIAAGICRSGGAASLLTSVSDDAVGRFTTLEMQRYKIGTTNVRLAGGEARTSLAVVETRFKDTQSVIYRNGAADFQLSKEDVGSVDFSGFGALIVTGTALAVEPSRAACFLAIEMAKAAGMPVVFDIDYRPYSWTDAKEAASVNLMAAQACDVVIGNDAEFDVMAGGAGLKQARELAKTSASIVVYKMGEKGSVTLHAGEEFETGIYRVEALKPTGAGDAFMAGFVTGLAAGLDVNACVLRRIGGCGHCRDARRLRTGHALAGRAFQLHGEAQGFDLKGRNAHSSIRQRQQAHRRHGRRAGAAGLFQHRQAETRRGVRVSRGGL